MKILVLSLVSISLWSCAKNSFQSAINLPNSNSNSGSNTGSSTPVVSNPPVDPTAYKAVPLAWESKVSGSNAWSKYIYNYIKTSEPQMLGQNVADDIETFCPKYRSLSDDQRSNFWGQLFAGVAKFESGWKPTSRMVETTMGTDPITGRQVASEGLLQLSYQDEGSYRLDCGFDWSKDKNLTDADPKKTILDPYNNLKCGISIMAKQLKNKRAIALSSNVYWAVLKINGKYTKITEIAAVTKQLPFCN